MTDVIRACALVVLFCAAQAGILTGRDFFCRDPDTGKLHAANSTWASTTFCGNYTCKLRKKNLTATEYAPFRQIHVTNNITKIDLLRDRIAEITDKIDTKQHDNKDNNNMNTKQSEFDDDRYLTDKEIKTISEILHLVKKSDLEAIIEIYKLAQDIYKEVDDSNVENLLADSDYKENEKIMEKVRVDAVNAFNVRANSYWNGPVFTKTQSGDLETQGTNILTSVSEPKKTDSYFIAPLISTDFRKLPYYYPVSSFQRISTYTHPKPINIASNTPPKQKVQSDIQPSIYLPYPFTYVHHYNSSKPKSSSKSIYYDKYDIYSKNKASNVKPAALPNAVLINPYLIEDGIEHIDLSPVKKEANEQMKATSKSKNKKELPDWQTSPLAIDVLEEVRAHIQDKKLIRPLRKNVKLERVGKVIKLEELPRKKRDVDNYNNQRDGELFEVFLEKTTCHSNDTAPGYFRHGNLSQPYPECCPQRIEHR